MSASNWVNLSQQAETRARALKLVEMRKQWEKEQIKKGKKEVKIPHEKHANAVIVKFI